MKDRYEQLVKIEQGFIALDCPVILETYAVLRDLKVGKTIALLKFRNCGTEAVARMCLKVQIVDVTGKCVEEIPDFEYKDVNAEPGQEFGAADPVRFSKNIVAKKLLVFPKLVTFSDGKVWEPEQQLPFEACEEATPLYKKIEDDRLLKYYQKSVCPSAGVVPKKLTGHIWKCACGALNVNSMVCWSCKTDKDRIFHYLNLDVLKENYCEEQYELAMAAMDRGKKNGDFEELKKASELFHGIEEYKEAAQYSKECEEQSANLEKQLKERKEQQQLKAEQAEKEAKRAAKRKKIIAAVCTGLIVAGGIGYYTATNIIIPNNHYNQAVSLLEDDDYDAAIKSFEALGDYKDSADMIHEVYYQEAMDLMDAGEYEEASSIFGNITGYKDSDDKVMECANAVKEQNYQAALALLDEDKYEEAKKAFGDLRGYKDSKDKIEDCQNGLNEQEYEKAAGLMKSGNYEEAQGLLENIEDFRDSSDLIKECKYQKAATMMKDGDYENAAKIFEKLGDYSDSKDQLKEITQIQDYDEAIDYLADVETTDDYTEKIELLKKADQIFLELQDYSDSAEQVEVCKDEMEAIYQHAISLKKEQKYQEAEEIFTALADYSDSSNQVYICQGLDKLGTSDSDAYDAFAKATDSDEAKSYMEKFVFLPTVVSVRFIDSSWDYVIEYDDTGKMTKVTDGVFVYTCDEQGRVVQNSNGTTITDYSYHDDGTITATRENRDPNDYTEYYDPNGFMTGYLSKGELKEFSAVQLDEHGNLVPDGPTDNMTNLYGATVGLPAGLLGRVLVSYGAVTKQTDFGYEVIFNADGTVDSDLIWRNIHIIMGDDVWHHGDW